MTKSPISGFFTSSLRTQLSKDLLVSRIIGIALSTYALVIIVLSFFKSGVAFDATFESGVLVNNNELDPEMSLSEAYEQMPGFSEFYGILIQKSAYLILRIAKGSSVNWNAHAFEVYVPQFMFSLCLTLIGASCLALALKMTLRHNLSNWLPVGLFLSMPTVAGMTHSDFKDSVFANGVIIFAFGLSTLFFNIEQNRNSRKKERILNLHSVFKLKYNIHWIPIGTLALGSFVCLGTRAGGILVLGALTSISCFFYFLYRALNREKKYISNSIVDVLLHFGITSLITFLALRELNPLAKIDFIHWVRDSIDFALWNPASGIVRTMGMDVKNNPVPWFYIPSWLFISFPVLTFLIGILGVFIYCKNLKLINEEKQSANIIAIPYLVIAGVIPFLLSVTGTSIIDGIRNILFVSYAFLFFICYGVIYFLHQRNSRKYFFIVLFVVSSFSVFHTVKWFPYNYAYKNALAHFGKLQPAWESDYLGISAREGIERLKEKGADVVIVLPAPDPGWVFGGQTYVLKGDRVVLWPDTEITKPFGVYNFFRYGWGDGNTKLPLDSCYDFPLLPCKKVREYKCSDYFQIKREGIELGEGAICLPNS